MNPKITVNQLQPIPPQHPQQPHPPANILNNPSRFPIHSIINHKLTVTQDKYKITKNITHAYANGH